MCFFPDLRFFLLLSATLSNSLSPLKHLPLAIIHRPWAPPKDYHDIAEKLRKIAGEVPDSHMATPCLGVSYWLDQDEKRAQNTFQKFIDDYPGLWDAYFWMSIVNVNQDRSDGAISDLEAALSRKMPPILLSPLRWFTPLPFQQRVRSRYKELFNYKSGHAFFSFFVPHGGQHKSSA